MKRSFYAWADVSIEVVCQECTLADHLDHCWRTFFGITATPPATAVLSLHLAATPTAAHSAPGQQLWCQGEASIWQSADGLDLRLGATSLRLDKEQRQAIGHVDNSFWHYPLAEQRDFFMRTLLLLLRQIEVYGLHANGVYHQQQGLLLVGPSGSGKTTLSLSLQQVGWQAVGDDVMALHLTAQGVTARPLQRGFACTAQTAAFFPKLPTAQAPQLDPLRQKKWLAPPTATTTVPQSASGYQPGVLLFPTISQAAHSHLLPLDATQTLVRLMEQSAALLLDRTTAARQLQLLQQLGRQARSYRVALGRDVYTDPPAVAALLNNL